ncbi:MAG: hypothetical protein QM638_21205 [Nocardioides sp.]|uniref:hypothetical protein n=1 Tax=Nocardioides sp. TaxID=35761 RepID=UPI0039E36BAA
MNRAASGPHLVLLALYALFILASGSRAVVQIATRFGDAPVAFSLSAVAACTYVAGWFAIRRAAHGRPEFARVMLWVELGGVLVIGTLSLLVPDWFPEASVWSGYGEGYGWVPAVLPILGLVWVHRSPQAAATPAERDSAEEGAPR